MEQIPLIDSAKLLRDKLGSIELSEDIIIDKEISQDAEIFYKKHFEQILTKFLTDQMLFISTKAETPEQFLFGRGTMNGLLLIKD